jgi:hypothetical protein
MIGMWSYPVPQFEVEHFPQSDGFCLKASEFVNDFDLIWYEDGKIQGVIEKDATIPVAYYIGDSTLSRQHYEVRLQQAKQNANMVFVDWDKLNRFSSLEMPVNRLSHCVNDKFFKDYYGFNKQFDVGIFQGKTKKRKDLNAWAQEFCNQHGLNLNLGLKYQIEYAHAMANSKIVINLNRNSATRGHRVFDAMGSRSCLFTDKLPVVSGELHLPDIHYVEYNSFEELGRKILKQLSSNKWQLIAGISYEYVKQYHTWSVRAGQLYKVLKSRLIVSGS